MALSLPSPRPLLLPGLALGALLLGALLPGCYFMRAPRSPMRALYFQADAHARRDCLLVLFPGMMDGAEAYQANGFIQDVFDEGDRCDVVSLDAHFRYYFERNLRDRVQDDILMHARLRGYQEIWLVGISMGGLGALMAAVDQPELVDGVVLLSPFLGERSVIEEVRDAGGLRAWRPAERDPYLRGEETYTTEIWSWLRRYATEPDAMPPLYLGFGEEDQLRPACEVLGEVLPEERLVTLEGGHDWETWRRIWRTWLPNAPWGYGDHGASGESASPRAASARSGARM